MTVQRLSGWADEIMPGLEQLGAGVKHLINPNYDIQQELKKRLAADPDLYQKIVDNENLNPGSTEKMFGSQANALLGSGRQSSSKSTVEKSTRDAYASGRTTKDLVEDKTALGNATTRDVTGRDQAGYRTAEAGATVAEAGAKVAPVEADYKIEELEKNFPLIGVKAKADKAGYENKIKQAEVDSKTIGQTLDAFPQLKGIKSNNLAKKFVNDPTSMTPQEQAQAQMLQTNEATKTLWGQQVQNLEHIRQINAEAEWHNSVKNQENKQIRAQAFSIAKDLNMPGNINAIMAYMTDPMAAQKAEAMASGKIKPESMMDNDLVEVARGIQQKQELKFAVVKTHAFTQIQAAEKQMGKANPNDRPALEAQINEALQVINSANGSNITYKYVDKFGPDEHGFYSIGPDGKEKKLNDEEFSKITFDKSMASKKSTGDPELDKWANLDASTRSAKLEEVRKKDPQGYVTLKAALSKAGIQ